MDELQPHINTLMQPLRPFVAIILDVSPTYFTHSLLQSSQRFLPFAFPVSMASAITPSRQKSRENPNCFLDVRSQTFKLNFI